MPELQPLSIRRSIADLPIPWKLALIVGIFCVVIFGNLAVTYMGMEILSGSRAYVGGEGLWSKAEKAAVYHLTRYALFHDEADYERYLEHISIPLGDHLARLELAKPQMNAAVVAQGFVQGRNHPEDVGIMTLMARKLSRFRYMNKALDIWGQADAQIALLPAIAEALHREMVSRHPSPERLKSLLNDIQAIDDRLTPLEDEFSYTLGEGARWLKDVLLAIGLLSTAFFLVIAVMIAVFISRHLCDEINQLSAGAARIAAGDYSMALRVDSKDEIGDLSRTFQQMAMQRHQAERMKDDFFATASHELRTPLTLILSPLESLLAAQYGSLDAGIRPSLETMHNNTVRLLQLVNGLLDFSKLEAGKIDVEREPIRIHDLTEMIYKDFQPMIKAKTLQARLEIDSPQAVVMMDRYLYERILFNLLSNAVKFTPPGGHVGVRLTWQDPQLIFSVTDTGIGIPQGELSNIFQRFRQVEGSSTRRFEGTGLGLALVKEFASLLGGTVHVESAIGKGSTFRVTCLAPRAESQDKVIADFIRPAGTLKPQQYKPALAPTAVTLPSSGDLPKVLIAEDNVEMASYIDTLLQPFCRTKIARDGNQALGMVHEWSPDLLLTDVMIPERDGLSLCREVKSNAATAGIPVVMLTALTHREALLEGWKAGANEYLFKPFHPKELVTRVQSLVQARQNQKKSDDKISHLNENLRRHALDLAAANQELEAFSYSVSHDLRAPLRAIDGFSKELLDRCLPLLDARGQDDLKRVRAAAQRMARLIDDLLELSHLSRSALERQTVDVSGQVREILQKLGNTDPSRPVESVIAPNVTAEADPRLLQIALENLIQNSWKFTQRQAHPKIEFGVAEQQGARVFFVRDNGVGFDMAHAAKLFKPFQRLHDAKEFPGTGIGLALVHRIIHRHGGRIWAQAHENRGAAFYFTLS